MTIFQVVGWDSNSLEGCLTTEIQEQMSTPHPCFAARQAALEKCEELADEIADDKFLKKVLNREGNGFRVVSCLDDFAAYWYEEVELL